MLPGAQDFREPGFSVRNSRHSEGRYFDTGQLSASGGDRFVLSALQLLYLSLLFGLMSGGPTVYYLLSQAVHILSPKTSRSIMKYEHSLHAGHRAGSPP